jgi:hypothetical protein
MNMEDSFCLSKSWKPLVCFLKDLRKPPQHDGRSGLSARLRRVVHSHQPKPPSDIPASLRYLCSLIPRRMPRLLSLTCRLPARHTLIMFLVFSYTSKAAFLRARLTPILVSYWFARGVNGCWQFHSVLRTSQRELSFTLPLPFCFLYKPGFPAGRLFCLPPAFTPVFARLMFSTLKMEANCSSKTSVDTQWTTRRYIPEGGTLHISTLFGKSASLC